MHKLIKQLKELNPKLNDFLAKKRLRTKYLTNCQKASGPLLGGSQRNISKIDKAFTWSKSPEGREFWEELYREFNRV